jgi:exopolysaccharide biosynthesis protein
MKNCLFVLFLFSIQSKVIAQLNWKNVSDSFGSVPTNFKIFYTQDSLDNKPNKAFYVKINLKDKKLDFDVDTTLKRRLTPTQFFEKNNNPLLIVNASFFTFNTHQNVNAVVKNKKLVGYNLHNTPLKGKDTFTYNHTFGSAIGIYKNRTADVAWLFTDSSNKKALGFQSVVKSFRDSNNHLSKTQIPVFQNNPYKKWKVKTAVGGGPVLLQNGEIAITNNEEHKFTGKQINDRHPRTAMGYTYNNELIILVIEGRNKGLADGATLTQLAQIFKDLGCKEAINLDGGGSSCMLINGKPTIKVSDKEGERPVPCVFMVNQKN